jgi:hypothetical protein
MGRKDIGYFGGKMRFTIGTDPEFFLHDGKKIVSAIPYIAGTKHNPQNLNNGSKLSFDNVALEFATQPAIDLKEFICNIENTYKEVLKNIPNGFSIIPKSSHVFEKKYLFHEEAKKFGCDPDFNAWTISMNMPSKPTTNLRSCGAHVHVGNLDEYPFLLEMEGKIQTVRTMDCILGISSIILDSSKESMDRKKLYGKAGCHRPTDYGIEYRVLSNFWLKSPKLVELIYNMVGDCLEIVKDKKDNQLIEECKGQNEICRIINDGDKISALTIINHVVYEYLSDITKNSLNNVLNKEFEFEKEWKLK